VPNYLSHHLDFGIAFVLFVKRVQTFKELGTWFWSNQPLIVVNASNLPKGGSEVLLEEFVASFVFKGNVPLHNYLDSCSVSIEWVNLRLLGRDTGSSIHYRRLRFSRNLLWLFDLRLGFAIVTAFGFLWLIRVFISEVTGERLRRSIRYGAAVMAAEWFGFVYLLWHERY